MNDPDAGHVRRTALVHGPQTGICDNIMAAAHKQTLRYKGIVTV